MIRSSLKRSMASSRCCAIGASSRPRSISCAQPRVRRRSRTRRQVLEVGADQALAEPLGRRALAAHPVVRRVERAAGRARRRPLGGDQHRHHGPRRILAVLGLGLVGRRHHQARRVGPRLADHRQGLAVVLGVQLGVGVGRAEPLRLVGADHDQDQIRAAVGELGGEVLGVVVVEALDVDADDAQVVDDRASVVLEVEPEQPDPAAGRDVDLLGAALDGLEREPGLLGVGLGRDGRERRAVRGDRRAAAVRLRQVVQLGAGHRAGDQLDRDPAVLGLGRAAADAIEPVGGLHRRDRVRLPGAALRADDRVVAAEPVRRHGEHVARPAVAQLGLQ